MKITIVHNNHKKQLLVSTKTMEKLLVRIAKDDSKQTVSHFRQYASYSDGDYRYYKDLSTWMHIYPAAEFAKDENGNLKMKACNGLLLLKFGNITDVDGVEGVKRSVAILPSTLAALEGADGKTVIVLVRFTNQENALPTSEPSLHNGKDGNGVKDNIVKMMQLLRSKYDFRYNTVLKYVEYLPKEKGWYGYRPVEPRVQKRMTLEVQLADIRVSIKDVRIF